MSSASVTATRARRTRPPPVNDGRRQGSGEGGEAEEGSERTLHHGDDNDRRYAVRVSPKTKPTTEGARAPVVSSVLEVVGNTVMVTLGAEPGCAEIRLKVEGDNPSG